MPVPRTRPATGKGRKARTQPITYFALPMNNATASRANGRSGGHPGKVVHSRGPSLGNRRVG